MDCERCGRPIEAARAERLAARQEPPECVSCHVDAVKRRPRPGIDDLRDQREGLPEALRRVEPLWEGD
jgi:hypothetical protein